MKSLATCQHITQLSLSGNHIGASGKHLADAINSWGDAPSLEELYLENCSIPEESCCKILKSLATCQHITKLSLNGNHIGASGKHLADAINSWGDAPSLEELYLENCSIPEESCCEILKSLATYQHITELSLNGNHIGASGKHLADAINSWGDAPSLEELYLSKSLHSRKSFVLGELSFARMPSRQYCLKVNKLHCWNCRPELVNCGQ